MSKTLSSKEHTARITHIDDGSDYFDFCVTKDENQKKIVDLKEAEYIQMTPDDIATLQDALDNNWRILPGQKYKRFAAVEGRDLWTFKTRSDIHALCVKYDLYGED